MLIVFSPTWAVCAGEELNQLPLLLFLNILRLVCKIDWFGQQTSGLLFPVYGCSRLICDVTHGEIGHLIFWNDAYSDLIKVSRRMRREFQHVDLVCCTWGCEKSKIACRILAGQRGYLPPSPLNSPRLTVCLGSIKKCCTVSTRERKSGTHNVNGVGQRTWREHQERKSGTHNVNGVGQRKWREHQELTATSMTMHLQFILFPILWTLYIGPIRFWVSVTVCPWYGRLGHFPIPSTTDDGWGGWSTHTIRCGWRMGI